MIVLELIIADAIRRAKARVPRRGLSRVDRQRALIIEALTYIGWDPMLAHRDAEAFSGGHWDEFVRGFADEWDRGRKPGRGHLLWGAKTYKLTPKQFDLLLGDEPRSCACLAHLAVRTFISIHPDVDGRVHRALFWTSRFEPSIPSSAKTSRQMTFTEPLVKNSPMLPEYDPHTSLSRQFGREISRDAEGLSDAENLRHSLSHSVPTKVSNPFKEASQ